MKLFKSDFEKHYEQGLSHHNNDKFDDAIKEFKSAIEIKSDDFNAHFALGNAYNVKGLHSEAIEAYKQCLKLNPNFSKARYMLKLISNEQTEKNEQGSGSNETVEAIQSTYKLGLECAKKNMLEDAIMAWEKTLKLFPNFEKCYYNLGVAYYKLNKFDEAAQQWNKAKMLDSNDDGIYFYLGIIYFQQQKIVDAIKEWEKAKELNPKNEKVLCNLAVAYFEQDKKTNKTMALLQEALKINPNYDVARENLQKLFVQK